MSDRRSPGFTLLEVLAAVAVLGFTVTVLARGAIQGMHYEGDASRRLAASLLADHALFEIESALALGTLPELGRKEREEGEFRLGLEVAPIDPAALGVPGLLTGEPASEGKPPAQVADALPKLLLVSVQVVWTEGLREQSVTRTTFAYDATAAAAALKQAGQGQTGETGEAGEPPEPATEPGTEEP